MHHKNSNMSDSQLETRFLLASVEIGKLLTSTLNLDEVLNLIMQKMSQLIPAENWSLFLLNRETGKLTFDIVVGIEQSKVSNIEIPVGEGIVGRVAETGEPLFISDAAADERVNRKIDHLTGFKTKSIIAMPLISHGTVMGVIEIINVGDIQSFQNQYYPVLKILADYAAIAIENSCYVERIKEMSITDEYTGLYNARYLHTILEGILLEAREAQIPVSVVFADVDNFKSVVDTYGHLCGGEVLKLVGSTMSNFISDDDLIIKYGGDEYILIFKGRNRQETVRLVEKIRQKIRTETYQITDEQSIQVTVSFGIAVFPEDAATKKELLIKADNFMYDVKRSTKDGIGTFKSS